MNETDYVLLINHDPLNVAGKFYDYIGGGKPILAAVHPDGRDAPPAGRVACWMVGGTVTTSKASASSFIDAADPRRFSGRAS
jgi:hypothetical protein